MYDFAAPTLESIS